MSISANVFLRAPALALFFVSMILGRGLCASGADDGPTLVINEFMAQNVGSIQDSHGDYDDWIELHNYGEAAVNIAGYFLTDDPANPAKWQIPTGNSSVTTIPAGGYLLVWADDEAGQGLLHANFRLSAEGEFVALHDSQQNVIDSLTFPSQEPDVSYGRLPDGGDQWQTFPSPTPGGSNDAAAGRIVISEIMYHPYHRFFQEDRRQEWIELFNTGPGTARLAGWRFSDGVEYVFPDVVLNAGQYLVVAADVDVFSARHAGVANVVGGWTGWLSNSGERIALQDDVGRVVDAVTYADQGDWAVRELGPDDLGHRGWQWSDQTDGGGMSLELMNVALPNEFGQNWAASLVDGGTPGSANSAAVGSIAPMIVEVQHSPLIPGPANPVTVTARVIDEAVQHTTVRLHYRVDRSVYTGADAYPQSADDFAALTMSDDGVHRDGTAGDGLYGVQILPYQDGTTIEFYVEAVDEEGRVRTWPAPSLVDGQWRQVTNALYRVDAALDPDTYWQIGGQPLYYLIMTEMERGRLAYIGTHSGRSGPDAQMNGTFISIDGTGTECRYRVGIRNRGHGTRNGPPNNYHVNFPHDQPWKDVGAVNFNCRYPYAQIMGSAIFHMAGFAAANATAAQLRINGADLAYSGSLMYGAYARIEAFDDDFANRHFPGDPGGNLYACFRSDSGGGEAELQYEGDDPNAYRDRYFKANHVAGDDWSDLIHMVDVLNDAPDDTYLQEVGEVINLPQWLRYIAVDSILLNYETGLNMGMGDDYFMYRGVEDPRFVLIPHDLDTILDQGNTHGSIDQSVFSIVTGVGSRNGVEGLKRLFDHPDIPPLYYGQLLDLIDTVFSAERFDPFVDQVLGGWVPEQTLADIKQFVVRRNAAVLAQIPQQLTVTSTLPVVDGYPYTTVETYALSGMANAVTTRSVLVNGISAAWSAREGTWQSGGVFGPAESLIDAGAEWRYLDDGSDQGTAWYDPGFSDGAWPSGNAELGYGDNDEATTVDGGPSGNRYVTTYFRKSFTATNSSQYLALRLRLLRDDGAVVYLNGVETCRNNMPQRPIDYTTLALANLSGQEERAFVEYELPPGLLHEGLNVLAVEIHQASPSSADISFDLALEAVRRSEGEGVLLPGINRIMVQSFDSRDGAGNMLEEGYIDVWYDDGGASEISGVLSADTVLAAAAGPWYVTGDVTVLAGVTLRIEPGATLFFDPDTRLTVNGRLIAEGTPYRRMRFTKVPGSANWAGLQFVDTQEESRLAHVDMEYCDSGSCAIRADHAAVYMDHVIWGNHTKQYLTFDDSSIVLKNSVLPSIEGDELVHYGGLPPDGYTLFEGNWFGTTTGYNDIIDLTGDRRPGPIARFINNTFTGASDDCIDLAGADAHVEGNVFVHVHADEPGQGQSHAVTTGTGQDQYSELTVVRNLFYDVDHALLSEDGGFITAVNNTIVGATHAAVSMYEARSGQWEGRGFYGDGNIFHDVAHAFENPDWVGHPTAITMNRSIFPAIAGDPVVWTGIGNMEDVDPQLSNAVNVTNPLRDMRLQPGSPAIGAGPNGRDMGGIVPPGASISGEPFSVTWRTAARLTVGGPDIYGYKYRVNNGLWSPEVLRPDAELPGDPKPLPPIELTRLQNGRSYTVSVIGKDSAGVWQSEESPTVSRRWTVDTSYRRLVINEVLAVNQSAFDHEGTFPDVVELYYDGPTAMSLAGMSLSDDPQEPAKFVFPAGVKVNPSDYLVLFADSQTAGSGLHLGFGLDAAGDAVYLYDETGALVDSVEFGAQLPDLSIGRIGDFGRWRLTVPTLGETNVSHPLGDPRTVKINEWLASEAVLFTADFIELYNPHPLPVDLGGFYITDTPQTEPDRHRLGLLNFVPGDGYLVLAADDKIAPEHLGFKLSSGGEMIALFDASFNEIDKVLFGPQTTDVSQGRSPNGSVRFGYFLLPTPGLENTELPEVTVTGITLVEEDAAKRAIVPTFAGQVPDDWKSAPDFDDSSWLSTSGAPGGVGYERSSGYGHLISLDVQEQMYGQQTTCYVRIPFEVQDGLPGRLSELYLSVRYDDGFVVWLNGVEVARANADEPLQWDSSASGSHEAGRQAFDTTLGLSGRIDLLHTGTNLLAFHGLNTSTTSGDFLISAMLEGGTVEVAGGEYPYLHELHLLDSLRVTELMYHAPQGDALDYIELQNIGGESLDLTGLRFTAGVDFTFPSMVLAPGECTVVVSDTAAFRSSYGMDIDIAGEYAGRLSNNGEDVVLQLAAPLEAAIMRFQYADTRYPATDGGGESLVIQDPTAAAITWNDPASWRSSEPTPGKP